MRTKKFLSFISFVGVISFSVSNASGATGPRNKIQEITNAPAAMRAGVVKDSKKDSTEVLKQNSDLGIKGVEEQSLSGNQSSEIGKNFSVSRSDEKRAKAHNVALVSVLGIFVILVLLVVALNFGPKDVKNLFDKGHSGAVIGETYDYN